MTWTPPDAGIVAFPRFESVEDTLELVARLRREHATVAVPGAFFGAPKHMRVGFGIPSDELSEGLRRLGLALDSLGA